MAYHVLPEARSASSRRHSAPQSTFDKSECVSELVKHGFTYIPFSAKALVAHVHQGYSEFLEKPHQERLRWAFGPTNDPDLGYIPRITASGTPIHTDHGYGGQGYDNKHVFHFAPSLFKFLDFNSVRYSEQLKWLEDMDTLWNVCLQKVSNLTSWLDEVQRGHNYYGRLLHPVAMSEHVLRIITYNNPMEGGMKLGKGHVDRNFVTLHVDESHPGLYITSRQKRRELYVPKEDHVLAFTSRKAEDSSGKMLHGTYHDIQVPPESISDSSARRTSIVFFSNIYPCPDRYHPHGDGLSTGAYLRSNYMDSSLVS